MKVLRPDQAEGLDAVRDTLRQGINRICLQAPTGWGKTVFCGEVVALARQKAKRAAFVVPSISLIDQTVQRFYEQGITDVGVIQANHHMTDWSKPVQICSVQTISSRGKIPDCDIALFDECHELHKAHLNWMADPAWEKKPIIGLTATPWAKGMGKEGRFQTLLKLMTTADAIDKAILCPARYFATGHPDLSGVKTHLGDYHEGQLSERMNQKELTADIIKTYKELWGRGKTIVFAVDCKHAESLQERFQHEGISCGYQNANTPALGHVGKDGNYIEGRNDICRKFHSGEYQVVSNVETLTTGVDWDVRCLILARPTKSEMLFVQIVGRALRTADGKENALILDHTGTTELLGFPHLIDHDHLDDGTKKEKAAIEAEKKEPLPKPCKVCACLKPPKMRKCPSCGHEDKIECAIMERDGHLGEIMPGRLAKKADKKSRTTKEEKRQFYRELMLYAAIRSFAKGWAFVQYIKRFDGEKPPFEWNSLPPANYVSPGTALWVRGQNARYFIAKKHARSAESRAGG
jgi:DNA repair protein RadD